MAHKTKNSFADATVLYRDHFTTRPGEFTIVALEKKHLSKIVSLHRAVVDALAPEEKAFILPKSRYFFEKHFERANGNAVLGIVAGDTLIGEASILHPSDRHPKTGMVDMVMPGEPDSLTLLQGVAVLPEYRRNGLMHKMVHAWLNHAGQSQKHHAIAEVEVHNISSWSAFLGEGLRITSIGRDPSDGVLLYNMHETLPNVMAKRLTGMFNKHATGAITCPTGDVETQKELLTAGYAIDGWDKSSNAFILTPNNNLA